MYNEAEFKFAYANRLLALLDIADELGYGWKDANADRLKLWNLKPLA